MHICYLCSLDYIQNTFFFFSFNSWLLSRHLLWLEMKSILTNSEILCMTTTNAVAVCSCFTNINPFTITKSHGDKKVSSPPRQMWPKTMQLRLHQTLELKYSKPQPNTFLVRPFSIIILINFLEDSLFSCHFKQYSIARSDNYSALFKSFHNLKHGTFSLV